MFGCLAPCPQEPNIVHLGKARPTRNVASMLWYDCECHLRAMLRWALKFKKDIRTSFLYLTANAVTL